MVGGRKTDGKVERDQSERKDRSHKEKSNTRKILEGRCCYWNALTPCRPPNT